MNNQEMIKYLKKEAASNRVLNDVLHSWASRSRTRNQVTVVALTQRMEKEGFKHTADEYRGVLSILGKCGVGRLELNRKGTRVIALRDIVVTLQSVGKGVIGTAEILSNKKRNKYKSLPASGAVSAGPQVPYEGKDRRKTDRKEGIYLGVYIHGKAVSIPVPDNFEAEDISYLMAKLKDGNV